MPRLSASMFVHPCRSLLASVTLIVSIGSAAWRPDAQLVRAKTEAWGDAITALEARDALERHPDDSVLFIGSSSIRRWETIVEDIAPYHPIQRGFGGAKFSDCAVFAPRLIEPHQFRALVIFNANDVAGNPDDATPEQVATWFRYLCDIAQRHQPEAEIFCVEITPSRLRWTHWPRIAALNAALATECAADPKLHFIATASAYLNADGEPRAEYFVDDLLHQNRLGYHVWAGIIKSHLDMVLRVKAPSKGPVFQHRKHR